jgi:hypothetical protein
MATLAELEQGLIKADAAGNADDARAFAAEIRRMRQQAAAPTPEESFKDKLLRNAALAGRAVGETALGLPAAFEDAVSGRMVLNALGMKAPSKQDQLKAFFDKNSYSPETKGERLMMDTVGGIYGAGMGGPAKTAGMQAINLIAGGVGGLAGGTARESGAGVVGQTGAGIGASLLTLLLGGTARGALNTAGRVIDAAVIPGGDVRAAARIANDAAGPVKAQIINELRNGQSPIPNMPMNAGQLATPTGRAEFAGLQRIMDEFAPSPSGALYRIQGGLAKDYLDTIAQKGTNALKDTKDQLWNRLEPDLKTAYSQAGQYGKYAPQIQAEYQRFAGAAKNAVGDVRRLENAKQLAEESASAFGRRQGNWNTQLPTGMPSAGGRYSYQTNLADVAEKGSQKAAAASLFFGDVARMSKNKLDALVADSYPLSGRSLAARMEQYLTKDGTAPLDIAKELRSKFVSKLAEYSDSNGNISPENLHAIRKEIGLDIAKNVKNPNTSWEPGLAAKFEGEMTSMIDEAMNKAAGTTKWTDWLRNYKEGMKSANDITIGRELMKQSFKPATNEFKPAQYLTAVENATQTPDMLRRTGLARFGNIDEAMTSRGRAVKDDLSRFANDSILYQDLAERGQSAARRALGEAFNPVPNVPMLKTAATVGNFFVRQLEGKGGKAATESLASMMQTNPKALADAMEKMTPKQKAGFFELLNRAALSQQYGLLGQQ